MGVFVLARVAQPLNSWRGILVAAFAAAGVIGAFIPFNANFFALILPTGTTLVATLIALGGSALIFVICYGWRRLSAKYPASCCANTDSTSNSGELSHTSSNTPEAK